MTTKVRIAIALSCAIVAVVASQAYAQDARRKEAQLRQETLERYGGDVVQLVVAAHQLEAGTTISESDVTLKEWVSELAPDGAVTEIDQAIGSTLSSPIPKGQVLTDLVLGSSGASVEIPAGTVAVSLALTDKLGLVSGVDAGSRVFAYRIDEGGTELISGKVTIVSVKSEGGALSSTKNVTVAAKPDDIPGLLEAAAQGTLRLVVPASNVTEASAGVVRAPSVVEPETDDAEDGNDAVDEDGAASEGDAGGASTASGEGEAGKTADPDLGKSGDEDSATASKTKTNQSESAKSSSKNEVTSELLEGDVDGR